jgi:membrane-associated protease RseP (regulator of RpoE activity)
MSPELAAMLDDLAGGGQAQKLTRNGEVGLRVTWVHKHSPAEKAGIVPGDVLLEIREEGKDEPIELRPRGDESGSFSSFTPRRRGGSQFPPLFASGPGPGGRTGYLTSLLTRLGAGTKIALVYLHGQEKVTQNFTLEWAPYDNASANKYKDEKTGVTVKDLTYDVRALLRLSDDQPGVIVSKTEDGQKAAVADISPGVIITEINGKPLKNVGDYEQAMAAIQQGKTGTAVLKLLWMGKNRMVKIEFP